MIDQYHVSFIREIGMDEEEVKDIKYIPHSNQAGC